MLKKLLIIGATSGLMTTTALAQQTTPPAPDTPAMKSDSAAPKASAADHGKFIPSQGDNWVASKFKGTDVLGPNNEKVGDVTDLLFDKNGKVMAYVIGVGGFLGIGQKDVALEPSAFQMVPYNTGSTASTTSGANTSNTGATSTTSTAASDNDPNHVKLKISMTKDELKNAPAFEYWKSAARTTSAPAGGTTGTAPRPAPAPR
jgi:PRC-barrel domain